MNQSFEITKISPWKLCTCPSDDISPVYKLLLLSPLDRRQAWNNDIELINLKAYPSAQRFISILPNSYNARQAPGNMRPRFFHRQTIRWTIWQTIRHTKATYRRSLPELKNLDFRVDPSYPPNMYVVPQGERLNLKIKYIQ